MPTPISIRSRSNDILLNIILYVHTFMHVFLYYRFVNIITSDNVCIILGTYINISSTIAVYFECMCIKLFYCEFLCTQ